MNGKLLEISLVKGKGVVKGNAFDLDSKPNSRIMVSLANVMKSPGSDPTLVAVRTGEGAFSFFLRDVSPEYPIYMPDYHVVVTASDDTRSYGQIEAILKGRKLRTRLQQIEEGPEETYDSAASRTRNQPCPTWLGVSRYMRIFELSDSRTNPASEMDAIRPRNASSPVQMPEWQGKAVEYGYVVGRGQGVATRISRRLEDGVLPILHSTLSDGEIEYRSTAFVSLERSPLTVHASMGTDWMVADAHSTGHMFTKEQEELVKPRLEAEEGKTESTVLFYRTEAANTGAVPRYAWFKTVRPGTGWWMKTGYSFDRATGFSSFSSGRVFALSRFNGRPVHDEETAVLLKPGEKAVFEFLLPHTPLSTTRALELSRQSFDSRYQECKRFWRNKLEGAARIAVPEQRINEMIQAGLLQLDLVTYGNEPDSTLAPTIGAYSPIGTESAPIIQFFNSMGLADIARRSLMFFVKKQHDDGMIQNFGGYLVETGAALWSMGEYYRYTKDKEWVRLVEPNVLRATAFLLQWREQSKKEELKGKGYGMIAGKVADPEDPFHQYMLNAYAYLGISRAAEMLKDADRAQSERLLKEAEAWKADIRNSLATSLSASPVVPLGDGRWCPTVSPWTEAIGPRALHVSPDTYFSHGTVTTPDVLLGPLYLVFCEVLAPGEPVSRMMLDYQSELFFEDNTAFSQPYYSRHDWLQLRLGLAGPFLKTYYNALSSLADRETYTFWEHTFQVSSHKTHEQGWFLMQTRWMLYLEEGETLKLLTGIPRRWMEDGKQITLKNVRSYFGPVSLEVSAQTHSGFIEASISCESSDKPHDVIIRLPHPDGKKAVRVTGGVYDPAKESIVIKGFSGEAKVRAEF
ncbi:hypothetical protein EHM92_00730 [bacterium]|nr:MAG: hypothetical protein EHM92_00730 [bacterium]